MRGEHTPCQIDPGGQTCMQGREEPRRKAAGKAAVAQTRVHHYHIGRGAAA
jgi:hypothetical protein